MFGKGVYFADMSSKSANYCWPSKSQSEGLLLLCEVSLGKQNELLNANIDADKLPKGKHSVKGVGRTSPEPENFTKLSDGTIIPMGNYFLTASLRKAIPISYFLVLGFFQNYLKDQILKKES